MDIYDLQLHIVRSVTKLRVIKAATSHLNAMINFRTTRSIIYFSLQNHSAVFTNNYYNREHPMLRYLKVTHSQ